MKPSPYTRFENDELKLTDQLAVDRTTLANERTFLAYLRTALALLVIGGTFLHFLEPGPLHVAGYVFLVLGAVVLVVGIVQFLRMKRRLSRIRTAMDQQQ